MRNGCAQNAFRMHWNARRKNHTIQEQKLYPAQGIRGVFATVWGGFCDNASERISRAFLTHLNALLCTEVSALPPHFSPSWPALCALVLHLPLAYPWPPAEQGAAACASLVQRVSMRANTLQMRQNACQMLYTHECAFVRT